MRPAMKFTSCLLSAALAVALQAPPARAQRLEEGFASPPIEARPRLRWWWPGAAVTDEELAREIRLMKDSGFGGAEIASFTPNFITLTPQERTAVNQYAEPEFFAHVRAALSAATASGLTLDYTLGSAWPSGGGDAVPPEKAITELTMASTTVLGGSVGPIKLNLPRRTRRLGALSFFDPRVKEPKYADWGQRMDARARTVAVVAMKGSAPLLQKRGGVNGVTLSPWSDVLATGRLDPQSRLVLTDRLRADGTLDWTPPAGEWQVFVFRQYATDMGVSGAAGQGPQLTLDHTDAAAFAAHASRVGEPLGNRPKGLRATFVDSLELMQDIQWGPRLLDEFRKRRGYDLTPYLPFVIQPGWMQAWDEHYSPPYFDTPGSDLGERVRADYRRTVSDMMFAGFIEPFVAWNHARGMKAKFQAHGGAFDIIRAYGMADIPETEDLPGGGDPFFMRLGRSGAHLYGRPIFSAESLAWPNRAFSVTPDEMRKRVDVIMAGGVNSMILHGMNYRFHADRWPGWHAFQPSAFSMGFSGPINETNPVWPGMKVLAGYIARLQSVMQSGKAVVPVAWFYGRTGYYVGIEDNGAAKQAPEKAFMAAGYDFDRINPDSLEHAVVKGRRLHSRGGQVYETLVLPPLDGIRAETMEAIARFARSGLPVFFADRVPSRDEGLADASVRDRRVRTAAAEAMRAGARVVPEAGIPAALRAAGVPGNLRFDGNAADLVFVQRKVEGRTVTFIHNRASDTRDVAVDLPGRGGVSRWNAMDGSITPVTSSAGPRDTRVPIALAGGESALLVLDPGSRPRPVLSASPIASIALPADGWSLTADGHRLRQPFAATFDGVSLGDWKDLPQLANFAGEVRYTRQVNVDPAALGAGRRLLLDLGQVHDIAAVSLNGKAFAPVIASPYRIDVTGAVRAGVNTISVTIRNVPQNAMIDPDDRIYRKLEPVPAGWSGPARLLVLP